jgi:outer membrane receptor protein involved in Fe transport
MGSGGNFFTANATYRYVGDRIPVLGALTPVLEAYGLLDLRTGVELKNGVALNLFADNVTNEIAATQFIAGNPISYQFINRPRTIGVSANLSF